MDRTENIHGQQVQQDFSLLDICSLSSFLTNVPWRSHSNTLHLLYKVFKIHFLLEMMPPPLIELPPDRLDSIRSSSMDDRRGTDVVVQRTATVRWSCSERRDVKRRHPVLQTGIRHSSSCDWSSEQDPCCMCWSKLHCRGSLGKSANYKRW